MMNNSLVKYDNPVLLADSKRRNNKIASLGGTSKNKTLKSLPPVENKAQVTQAEEILNSILPPVFVFKYVLCVVSCINDVISNSDLGTMVVINGYNMSLLHLPPDWM